MKKNLANSFRVEVVIYIVLSLILTIATEVAMFGVIFLIIGIVNPLSSYEEYIYNEDVKLSFWFNPEFFTSIFILAIIIGIGLFIFYFLMFTRKFTRELKNIVYGIGEISSGDFNYRLPIESTNEFGLISLSLNKMALRLEQIMEENKNNEKNKNAIITSLAHDLRTPLTSITGYLELLVNAKDISEETYNHYLELVYKKSISLENLINDLFDYTRVSLGQIKTEKTTINMVQFINQIVDEFYPSFRENDLEYGIKIENSPIYIEGDGDLLSRAINNLISNAIKYGKDGKRVDIHLKVVNNYATLDIINYGLLIPKESLTHIFERFYRVEGSRSTHTGGTGLGLAIAKEIIELHGGKITVNSDFKGTVFQVRLKSKEGGENDEKE
ncbi:MAG TPA: HAMP domain-containing protein [Clostridiales bacterium]|nr:HAMP domain-containing protein [Clostridiales bacterium]